MPYDEFERDEKYEQAVGLLVLTGRGSTSFIQRKMGLGYNAACRLIERAEAEGILAKPNRVGEREVLARPAAKGA
jgi:DNA segregation ATPase FtsK/SpoIIIE, S-DNA-T family